MSLILFKCIRSMLGKQTSKRCQMEAGNGAHQCRKWNAENLYTVDKESPVGYPGTIEFCPSLDGQLKFLGNFFQEIQITGILYKTICLVPIIILIIL